MERSGEYAENYTIGEMMVTTAAKELRDGELVFAGIGIPTLATILAKYTVAPRLSIVVESGCIAPQPRRLIMSVGDNACAERAVCLTTLYTVFSDQQRGLYDVGVVSGAQVDKYGNLNSTCIGDYEKPTVRFTGSGGANDIASSVGRTLILMRLERRRFVKNLDFLTSPGYLEGYDSRRKAGLTGGGPSAVITDKCVFRFDPVTKEMYLDALYPRVSVEDVVGEVSWKLKVPEKVKTAPPLTVREVELIRMLDPLGLYTGSGKGSRLTFQDYVEMLKKSYMKLTQYIRPHEI